MSARFSDLLSIKKGPGTGKIKPREDQKWQTIKAEHGQQTLQHKLSWFVILFHRLMKMQESMHRGTALKLITSCHVRCVNSDSQLQKLSYMLWIVTALERTQLKMVQVCCFLWFAIVFQFWPTPLHLFAIMALVRNLLWGTTSIQFCIVYPVLRTVCSS